MKHTPGPWMRDGSGAVLQAKTCQRIATVGTDANARLIAAAPELLAALEATLTAMRNLRGLAFTGSRIPADRYPEKGAADAADALARSALAKATGSGE